MDRLAAHVRQAPAQNRLRAGRKRDLLAVDRLQRVVAPVDERAKPRRDLAGVGAVGDNAGRDNLAGMEVGVAISS